MFFIFAVLIATLLMLLHYHCYYKYISCKIIIMTIIIYNNSLITNLVFVGTIGVILYLFVCFVVPIVEQ